MCRSKLNGKSRNLFSTKFFFRPKVESDERRHMIIYTLTQVQHDLQTIVYNRYMDNADSHRDAPSLSAPEMISITRRRLFLSYFLEICFTRDHCDTGSTVRWRCDTESTVRWRCERQSTRPDTGDHRASLRAKSSLSLVNHHFSFLKNVPQQCYHRRIFRGFCECQSTGAVQSPPHSRPCVGYGV